MHSCSPSLCRDACDAHETLQKFRASAAFDSRRNRSLWEVQSFILNEPVLLLYSNPAEISIENQRRTVSMSDTAIATALQSLQHAPCRSKAERFVKLEKPAPPHTEGSAAASSSGRCRWSLNHITFSIEMRPRVCWFLCFLF